MNTPTPTQTRAINAQTAGPLECATVEGRGLCTQRGFSLWSQNGECVAERRPETSDAPREPMEANARLLTASYTAFDRAGRELGIDAAELAESIDIAEMIRCVNALRPDSPFARQCEQAERLKLGFPPAPAQD